MEQVIFNFYPIFKFIVVLFAVVGCVDAIKTIANILGRYGKDKLDNKKDLHAKGCDANIIQDLVQKFPLVQKDFMVLTEREQNIENNQEIQEINERLDKIEFWLSRLNLQQSVTLDEIKEKNK